VIGGRGWCIVAVTMGSFSRAARRRQAREGEKGDREVVRVLDELAKQAVDDPAIALQIERAAIGDTIEVPVGLLGDARRIVLLLTKTGPNRVECRARPVN
jgi:hypothetical protein